MWDREREVEPDVSVHVREPARLAHVRIAVKEHERCLTKPLDQRLEVRGVGAPEMEVGVAEAAVHLYRQGVTCRLVRLERGDDVVGDTVEAATVGGDRLQCDVSIYTRARHVLQTVCLEPQDWARRYADRRRELVPGSADVRRRISVVEEQ